MPKLTQAALRRLIKKTGRHSDGGGLYFRVIGEEKAYFVYRYRVGGKERETSLGPFPELTLAEAREKHADLRKSVVVDKADPLADKRAAKTVPRGAAVPTFGDDGRRLRRDARSDVAQCEASLPVAADADRLLRPDPAEAGRPDRHGRRAGGAEAAVEPRAGDRVKAQGTHPDRASRPRRPSATSPRTRPTQPAGKAIWTTCWRRRRSSACADTTRRCLTISCQSS